MDFESIFADECKDLSVSTYIKVGQKRVRITVSVDSSDSEDEWDEWFQESALKKAGLCTMWVHPANACRPLNGEFVRICLPYRKHPDKFFSYFRMSVSTFDYVLEGIEKYFRKSSNRPSISPAERLCVTLRYLSTGISYKALSHSFCMSDYTVSLIVKEVCAVLWKRFVKEHMSVPTVDDFEKIAQEYEVLWNFPNVIGSVDGKHVRVKCPKKSGSMYYNYARYRFLFVDVGAFGKQSDGGTFDASSLSDFVDNRNNFPSDRIITGMDIPIPSLLLADDAYPLKEYIMKPYSHRKLTREERIFNGRLSRGRRCVECAFGILANKWRLLLKTIEADERAAEGIIKGATILHNLIIDREGVHPLLLKGILHTLDAQHEIMSNNLSSGRRYNRGANDAMKVRNTLAQYFSSPHGSVPWNDRYTD